MRYVDSTVPLCTPINPNGALKSQFDMFRTKLTMDSTWIYGLIVVDIRRLRALVSPRQSSSKGL